jgi:hypothetical protein
MQGKAAHGDAADEPKYRDANEDLPDHAHAVTERDANVVSQGGLQILDDGNECVLKRSGDFARHMRENARGHARSESVLQHRTTNGDAPDLRDGELLSKRARDFLTYLSEISHEREESQCKSVLRHIHCASPHSEYFFEREKSDVRGARTGKYVVLVRIPRPTDVMAKYAVMKPPPVSVLTVVSRDVPTTMKTHASHICGLKIPKRLTEMPAMTPAGATTAAIDSLKAGQRLMEATSQDFVTYVSTPE